MRAKLRDFSLRGSPCRHDVRVRQCKNSADIWVVSREEPVRSVDPFSGPKEPRGKLHNIGVATWLHWKGVMHLTRAREGAGVSRQCVHRGCPGSMPRARTACTTAPAVRSMPTPNEDWAEALDSAIR